MTLSFSTIFFTFFICCLFLNQFEASPIKFSNVHNHASASNQISEGHQVPLPEANSVKIMCGYGGVDLSSLANGSDWVFEAMDQNSTYFFRPCGTVGAKYCSLSPNTADSMLCQVPSFLNDTNNSLLSNDTSLISWTLVNPQNYSAGLNGLSISGTPCNGIRAVTTISFSCPSSAYPDQSFQVYSQSTCHYSVQAYSTLVCWHGEEEEKEKKRENGMRINF